MLSYQKFKHLVFGFIIDDLLIVIFKMVFVFGFVNINVNFIIPTFFYPAAFIKLVFQFNFKNYSFNFEDFH